MDGKVLLFTMGVHCETKKMQKKIDFSLKYVITLLSIISGGIKGIFVPLQNAFNMNQDAFGLVKE